MKISQKKPNQNILESDINKIYMKGPILISKILWGVLWPQQVLSIVTSLL